MRNGTNCLPKFGHDRDGAAQTAEEGGEAAREAAEEAQLAEQLTRVLFRQLVVDLASAVQLQPCILALSARLASPTDIHAGRFACILAVVLGCADGPGAWCLVLVLALGQGRAEEFRGIFLRGTLVAVASTHALAHRPLARLPFNPPVNGRAPRPRSCDLWPPWLAGLRRPSGARPTV